MIEGMTVEVERRVTADIPIIDLLDSDDEDEKNNSEGLKRGFGKVSGGNLSAIIPQRKRFLSSPHKKIVGNKKNSSLLSQTSSKSKCDDNDGRKKRKHTVLSKKQKDELLTRLRKERDLLKKEKLKNPPKKNRSQEGNNNLKKNYSSNAPQPVTIDLIESEDENNDVETFPNFYRPSCVDDVSSLSDCSYQRANKFYKNGSQRPPTTSSQKKKSSLPRNSKPFLVATTTTAAPTTPNKRISTSQKEGTNYIKKKQISNHLTSKKSKPCPPRKPRTPSTKNISSGEAVVLNPLLSLSSKSQTCSLKNPCTKRIEPQYNDDKQIVSNTNSHSADEENTSQEETPNLNLSSYLMKSTTYSLRKPSVPVPTKKPQFHDSQQCNQNEQITANTSQKEASTSKHPSSSSSKLMVSPLRRSCSPPNDPGTDQSSDIALMKELKGGKVENKKTGESKETSNEHSHDVEKIVFDDNNSLDIQDQTSEKNNWFHFVEENGLVMITGHDNENRKLNFPWPARIVSAEESDDWRLKCEKNNIHVPSNKICVILFFPCWEKGMSIQLDVPDHWWHVEFVDESNIFPFQDVDIECERLPQDIVLRYKKGLNVANGLREWALAAGLKRRKKPYKCKTDGTKTIHHNVVEYGAILKIRDSEWLESSNHFDSSKIVEMINFELPGYHSQYLNHSKRRRRSDERIKIRSNSGISNPQDTGSDISKQGTISPVHELLNQQACSHDLFGATNDETVSKVSKVDKCARVVTVKEEPISNNIEPSSVDLSLHRILGKQNRIMSKSKESQAIFSALENIPLKPGSSEVDGTAVLNVIARLCTRVISLETERDQLLHDRHSAS